jgi:hypothetical protein
MFFERFRPLRIQEKIRQKPENPFPAHYSLNVGKIIENVGKCWDFSFEMLEKCWMTFKNVEKKFAIFCPIGKNLAIF